MARQPKTLGFIAIERSIFDHPALRKPERFRAWQWLIAQAAWKPEGRRGTWGVVHLERGQIATSSRTLAKIWRWPRSNVQRFIDRLERDGMVTTNTTRETGPPTGPPTGLNLEHDVCIITICNYDKFQGASPGPKIEPGHRPGHRPENFDDKTYMLPGFSGALTTEPINHSKLEQGGPGDKGKRAPATPPRHGQQSAKHGTTYIHRGTEEWRVYADDYRGALGAEPMPDRHGGFWFYTIGEKARPAHQRHWRKVRFGKA